VAVTGDQLHSASDRALTRPRRNASQKALFLAGADVYAAYFALAIAVDANGHDYSHADHTMVRAAP